MNLRPLHLDPAGSGVNAFNHGPASGASPPSRRLTPSRGVVRLRAVHAFRFPAAWRWLAWLTPRLLLAHAASPSTTTTPAVPGAPRPWDDYRVIMWVGDSAGKQPERLPLFLERLREMGVDTAMVHGGGADPRPWVAQGFPYYVENIVNRGLCLKWNSRVTDWDAFVTTWARTGRPATAFVRDYCLDDPAWLAAAADQMREAARKHGPHAPLAYNIRDELSVTISANPFDFDFAPAALAGFRDWLRTQYRDLAALNAAWETTFATWDDVRPFGTDQVKNRMASGDALPRGNPDWQAVQALRFDPTSAPAQATRWNLSPWCDFRSYMDFSLARTLQALVRAAREIDPRTPVGVEGTQMPHAFGGYDLARLARALDWIEPYDIGDARAILGSFMPGKPILTTVFEKETHPARRRLWHLLLEGDRGCLIWWSEDCLDWNQPDWPLTAKARALAPVLRELHAPLARLFLRAARERDPIYLHYSQPSIQVNWLLESTVDGSTWPRRFSSFESEHNRQAKVRHAWLKAIEDLGWSPQFISSIGLEHFRPGSAARAAFVLPQSWALSDREAAALRAFLGAGGERVVLADSAPGAFDEHGRLRRTNALATWFAPEAKPRPQARSGRDETVRLESVDLAAFARERLKAAPDPALWRWLRERIGAGPIQVPPEARVRVHRFKAGAARLVAFERNVDYQMSEDLKQAGGNEALEQPIDLTAQLTAGGGEAGAPYVYDLRAGRLVGRVDHWSFRLDPWEPSLFALLPEPLPAETLVATLLQRLEP